MFKVNMLRLTRKLLVLSILIFSLGMLISAPNMKKVQAIQCCSRCQPQYNSCLSQCGGSQACQDSCLDSYLTCQTICDRHC